MKMNPYHYFDDIVCINLQSRPDKRAIAQQTFDNCKIPARFFTAQKHPLGGRMGCFDSHIRVISEAYRNGHENIVIFEDDIKPSPSYSMSDVAQVVDFLMSRGDVDILYLGFFPFTQKVISVFQFFAAETISDHFVRFNPFATHAYCLTRSGMAKILDQYQQAIDTLHYDWFLSASKINKFCYVPVLFEQRFCMGTDNSIDTATDTAFRGAQRGFEQIYIMYIITLAKYELERRKLIITVGFILVILLVVMVLVLAKSKSKSKTKTKTKN